MELINGKNVVIVGATSGIASEAAKMIQESGGKLYITGRNKEKLAQVKSDLNLSDDRVFRLDVSHPEEVKQVADQIHAQITQVDILIIASGIGILKPMEKLTPEDFHASVSSNLFGPFLIMQAFLGPMKEAKKGFIINIPGVLGKISMAGASVYAATKWGLNGMVKSLREELRRTEIRISNLYLGGVDSPFWDNIDMKVQRDKFITEKEAARAVWFMCQQPSSGVVSEMVIQPFNHQAV
jgi:NADP-dependent 3-hydroxy acid dehydrogenase YdfG